MSHPIQDLQWSKNILLQFGRGRESKTLGGQQNLVPNLRLYNPIVFITVSLFSLLFMLHNSLGSFNQLLHPRNKLGVNLTLNPYANHNANGVYQFLTISKLSWREICARASLKI